MTLPRGRSHSDGRHGHVIDYRHVIHCLRKKPGALPRLVYRDQLFPREAYRQLYRAAMEALPERHACRLTVELLSLAHERGIEAELAQAIQSILDAGQLPALDVLRARFAPDPADLPDVVIKFGSLTAYDSLIGKEATA